ncbi:MAG: acyl-CoA dehydrogenase family protein [Rhizomicrobium sp.]
MARAMVRNAASTLDRRVRRATMSSAMAKRFVTDTGFWMPTDALHRHGGYGYLEHFPADPHVRDMYVRLVAGEVFRQ